MDIIFNKCLEIIKKNNGILLSKKLTSIKSRLKIQCSNGHIFTKNYKSIYKFKLCKKCKIYKNENICKTIFESLFNCNFTKIRPDWLINPKTNRKLELDGYNDLLKIAFEYDGEFHYKKVKSKNYTSKKVLDQQYRDSVKDKICFDNNILLIRIPYYIKKKDYQEYIIKSINDYNIKNNKNIIIVNNNKVDIYNIVSYCNKLNNIKEYALENNIKLISNKYNNLHQILEWKCQFNHIFQCNYINFQKRKNKCLLCKKI